MRINEEEKQAVLALRELDDQQRTNAVAYLSRQALANRITAKVAGVTAIHTISDRKVAKAFGTARPHYPGRKK